jgi:Na+-driven multidrug efflux pump
MSHVQPVATEEVKPKPGIWELAWPAILTNLLFSVIGIVTIKIIGSLGAEAVAAVTTGHRIFFGLQAILMAIRGVQVIWLKLQGSPAFHSGSVTPLPLC